MSLYMAANVTLYGSKCQFIWQQVVGLKVVFNKNTATIYRNQLYVELFFDLGAS